MNPNISGQNSGKFGEREFTDLWKQYLTEEGKNVPTKLGVRYLVQMLEDIKGVLDASTEMSKKIEERICKNSEFFKTRIN